MTSLGKRLLKAAKEARQIARGEIDPAEFKVHIPRQINVRAIRARMKMTQQEFSVRYGLTLARLRDWEQGRSEPDSAARAYITVIEREPKAVERALARSSG